MLISMIVPIYNVENELKELITNLKNFNSSEIEIIFVDDGSTDNSLHELKLSYKNLITKTKYKILSKKNGGLSDARNFGRLHAGGDFIWFIDADDLINIKNAKRIIQFLENNRETELLLFKYKQFSDSSQLDKYPLNSMNDEFDFVNIHDMTTRLLLRKIESHSWGFIARRRIYEEYNIFFPKDRSFEDFPTTYKIFYHVKNAVYFTGVAYFYRYRSNSIVNDPKKINKNVQDIMKSCDEILNTIDDFPEYEIEIRQFVFSFLLTALDFANRSHFVFPAELKSELDKKIRRFDVKDFPTKKRLVHFMYRMGIYQAIKKLLRRTSK